ncbi:hypothetical protein J4450_06040 [Candidatus Micrarchaeota archaeon]|nr:hypothetical protein [Candidatus Micrarchaeota archaeon]
MEYCFACGTKSNIVYRSKGTPLCPSCETGLVTKEVRCSNCKMPSTSIPVIRYEQGLFCSTCAIELIKKKKIEPPAPKEYYKDTSSFPLIQSFVHIALIILLIINALAQTNLSLLYVELFLAAFLVFLLITFATIKIEIYEDKIECDYGFFTYEIKKKDIIKAEVTTPSRFFGYGVLIGKEKDWIIKFLTGREPCVGLYKRSGFFKKVFISTPQPAILLENIAKRMP